MSLEDYKQPKYNFGLLETPSSDMSTNCSTSVDYYSSSSLNKRTAKSEKHQSAIAPSTAMSRDSGQSDGSMLPSSSERHLTKTPALTTDSGSMFKTPYSRKTPRTSTTSKTPASGRTPYTTSSATPGPTPMGISLSTIVALVEGRGLARGEIGMASIDLKRPELILSQFSDMQTYVKTMTKLQILHPVEIIVPNTAYEGGNMTKLTKLIQDEFSRTSISTVQRKYFSETKGLMYVRQLCVAEYRSVELEVSAKYYCLAAGAALMKYVEFIQNMVYAPASLKVVFKGSENTTMIDAATVCNLELLQNLRDPRSDHNLYGVLNYTQTAGGARLLRSNILQPPSDLDTITLRQNVVSELTEKEDVFYNLQAVISRFLDIDHLLSMCVQIPKKETLKTAESKITNIMYLKHTLELVEPLRDALGDCENPLMKASYKLLEDARFTGIMNKIGSIIHEEARYQKGALNMRSQKCFAVKQDVNGLLDVARRSYTEMIDDISEMVNQLKMEYNLQLRSAYSTTRGFYIQLYSDTMRTEDLPGIFIKVTKFKNTFSFTTLDLIKMNDRVKESLNEIYLMASIVMTQLFSSIRDDIGCLYKLSETVARVDMLLSFAHACTLSDFVRPEFTDTLAVRQGRHPILERISVEPPVANDICASEDSNFVIITGPNMSGKSTYLRQIALLQIMAQMGCFVPAEYASFRIAHQIFSRIGSDDDLETNSSTFVLEMRETNYILQAAAADSLIIIDELGRGTSAEEGVGLCYAICEYLLRLKAFTFFVTHFQELTGLDSLYPNVENCYFETQRSFSIEGNCQKVIYTHVLSKGKTEEKHYGIQLAEVSTMPKAVVDEARSMAVKISEEKQRNQRCDTEVCRQRAVLKLATRLAQAAKSSRLDETSLRHYLHSLKHRYLEEINELEE